MLSIVSAMLLMLSCADPTAELAAGRAEVRGGDALRAAQRIAALCATYPTWGLARIELAEALMKQASPDPAALAAAIAAAVELEPENPRAWQLAARWNEQRGEIPAALEAWRRVLTLRPEDSDALERIGILLVQSGRPGQAVPLLEALLAGRTQSTAARANLAEAYEAVGNVAAAEACLVALVSQNSRSAVFRRRLAGFYDRTGQPEKAQAVLKGSGRAPRTMRPLPPSRR